MAITINTNVASLEAQRNLMKTSSAMQKNISHLSSGLRITQASDDAAGLGISEKLKAQVRGYQQAQRNANDGVSMIQVAEGAMNEQAGILTRLRELAVQSANGTLGSTERGYIDNEAKELLSEVDRISSVTSFNGTNMLSTGAAVSMQVGVDATANDSISVQFAKTDSTTLGVKYGSGNDVDLKTSAATAQASLAKIDAAISSLSGTRATVGASQNRLEVTINNLSSSQQQAAAANSRIRDVDVAEETAAMTRNQVLSQAGLAVLGQANQIPSSALNLLRG